MTPSERNQAFIDAAAHLSLALSAIAKVAGPGEYTARAAYKEIENAKKRLERRARSR